MPIKLLVTHSGDENSTDEHVYHQETVMIGRDAANALSLPDPARIVSKHHAEIRKTDDGGYEIVDLGSKNFTYLNGRRLTSGQPSRLNPGDQFKVGEFEVTFQLEAPAYDDEQPTVFAAAFVNPFEEPAEKLAEVLGSLRRVYAMETGPRRAESLRDALNAAMIGGGDEPGTVVAQVLGGGEVGALAAPPFAAPSPAAPPPAAPSPPAAPATPFAPPTPAPPAEKAKDPFAQTSAEPFAPFGAPPSLEPPPPLAPPPPPAPPPMSPPAPPPPSPPAYGAPAAPMAAGSERVLDVLLDSVSKLIGIPWRFRHEFIGQTIVHSEESAALYDKTPAELKAYLSDPREQDDRLDALSDAAEAVAVHQLAMLDGYKASVQLGAKRLLDAVDPAPIEAEVEASGGMFKLAQRQSKAVLERVKEVHKELGGEDWSVAERRAFRPAFIKAYLARMTRRKS